MFDWQEPTAQMLGRWQPWHDGHTALFKKALMETGQVCIMIRDVGGIVGQDVGAGRTAKQDDNPFILGGAEIYRQALPLADELDITWVHKNFKADAFFPEIDFKIWKEISREDFKEDSVNKYDYSFVKYKKVDLKPTFL